MYSTRGTAPVPLSLFWQGTASCEQTPSGLFPMAFQKSHGPTTLGAYFRPDMCHGRGRKHGHKWALQLPRLQRCRAQDWAPATARLLSHARQCSSRRLPSLARAQHCQGNSLPESTPRDCCALKHSRSPCCLARFSHPTSQSRAFGGRHALPRTNQTLAGDCATCSWSSTDFIHWRLQRLSTLPDVVLCKAAVRGWKRSSFRTRPPPMT